MQTRLVKVLFFHRTVPHSITNICPCVSLNKRKYVTINDKVNPMYSSNSSTVRSKVIPQYAIGDKVLALNLREEAKWLEGAVIQKLGVNVYTILIRELNVVWKRHANQLLYLSCPINDAEVRGDRKNRNIPVGFPPIQSSLDTSGADVGQQDIPAVCSADNEDVVVNEPFSNINNDSVSVESVPELRRSTRTRKPPARYGFEV